MAATELHDLVAAHQPAFPRERASHRAILRWLRWLPHPLDKTADPVHVTASAIVVDGRGRTLLHRHRRLGLWLQPGGHVDPDERPADAALREAQEETGLPLWHVAPDRLLHVDVHEGGRGHLHLDLRWLLHADGDAPFAPAPGESSDLRWVPIEDIDAWGDASVADAVRAVIVADLDAGRVRAQTDQEGGGGDRARGTGAYRVAGHRVRGAAGGL